MLKIIIAEDDPYIRLILRRIIEKISGLEVVAEAEDGIKLIRQVEKLMPDVVFLDITMPTMNGLEAAKKIFSIDPTIAMIFATAHDSYMREAFEVYAFDYLVKPFNLDRIRQTLSRIKEIKAKERGDGSSATQPITNRLTGREKQILRLLKRGLPYKEIAAELNITIKTVESHVTKIFRKLQCNDRFELIGRKDLKID
ncbi:MAG: response regulator transcription factor [Actinobacteria bacterium]|nr:response regulator transcription factor [Actinomycetota bacterium]